MEYYAIIHKDEGSGYGVSFPDFPGCVAVGESLEEARALAAEALALHLEGMREDGEATPAPMALDDAYRHEFAEGLAAIIAVPAPDDSPKYVRVTITVPESDLARIDDFVKARGMPRSTFLVQAANREMAQPS